MKETGIIMSGDHPRLILEGLKTMTRRTWGLEFINQTPDAWQFIRMENDLAVFRLLKKHWADLVPARSRPKEIRGKDPNLEFLIKCPYGQVGERLYVKETYEFYRFLGGKASVRYTADNLVTWVDEPEDKPRPRKGVHPSIHMPRWASRALLEITGLRAERLQGISPEDCIAEGLQRDRWILEDRMIPKSAFDLRESFPNGFKHLWDSLNAKRGYGWDFNPWNWPIGFKVVAQRAGLV